MANMTKKQLRHLLYTTGALTCFGILLSAQALERVNDSTLRADNAIAAGIAGAPTGGPQPSRLAFVVFERANDQASRATLALALAATLTPLLIFLNVLRFAGSFTTGASYYQMLKERGDPERDLYPIR